MKSKHILLTILLLTLTFSANAEDIDDPIRFAIIGDRTGGHVPGVYGEIIQEIELLKPDFTMTVGDMIEGYTEDVERLTAEWNEYLEIIKPLSAPIHHTPGNHDITNEAMLEPYQKFLGDPYRSFDYEDVHFVIMDNSRWNSSDEIPKDQIKWLKKDLKKHKKAPYTLVFLHKPFWFNSLATGQPDALHDIFIKYGVDAVFTGHFHTYFSDEYDNIIYTSMGSSGGASQPGITGLHYHYAWVTINSDGIHIALVKKGSVLPWDEVTADDLHTVSDLQQSFISFEDQLMVIDGKIPQTTFTLTMNNSTKFDLDEQVEWQVPTGWTVEPSSMRVNVVSGQTNSFRFTAQCDGILFPAPLLKFNAIYREGRTFELEGNLPLMRSVTCTKAPIPPVLDGMVSEGEVWQHGETSFFPPEGGEPKIEPVSFHFAYDDKNLYLAAVCQESVMDSLAAKIDKHDGPIYGEDCVGFFISPGKDSDANYQLYFNPNASAFDQKIGVKDGRAASVDKEWNCTYEAKTVKKESFWAIEIKLPLDQFGVSPSSGDEWKINFRRKQHRLGSSGDWMIPISYDPVTYGVLKFE